jgi:hypothetical protein
MVKNIEIEVYCILIIGGTGTEMGK